MKSKKFFASLLTLSLGFSLVGCASTDEPDTPKTTLNVWAIESNMITDYATNKQSQYMEKLTGVQINWIPAPVHGWYSVFQASVMSNEDVDIYLYNFDTTEAEMLGTQMQYIIPLEDLITPENTPNIWSILEENPGLKELITAPDGHVYSLFSSDTYTLSAYTQKLWVNKNWLEDYTKATGNTLPTTTAAFENMLQYFKANDMNNNGVFDEIAYIGASGIEGTYNLFNSFLPCNSSGNAFGCYKASNGELTFAYTQETFKEALAYVQGLYAQGLISPDTFTTSDTERYALTSGNPSSVRAGVVTGVDASQTVQLSTEEGSMDYDDYIPLPPLEGPDGARGIMTTGETSTSLRNAITIHCDDPVAAIKWLDAGYSEEARMYAVYGGLENVDWKYAEGETLNGKGQIIVPLTEESENSCWRDEGIVYRVTEQDYLTMDASQIATNDALATYRANVAYRPYAILNPWPSIVWAGEYAEEASQYSELNGLIQKTFQEYTTDVILGRKNLEDDWDDYVAELEAIGLDRYLELCNLYMSMGE